MARKLLLGYLFSFVFLWTPFSLANVLGNMQTFSPSPDLLYFETVHSSQTLDHRWWNVGFYTNYARNHLVVFGDLDEQNRLDYKDSMLAFDFLLAYGLTPNFQLTYVKPGLFDQSSDDGQDIRVQLTRGGHTHRPGFKWSLANSDSGGFALVGSVDFPYTQNDPYTGLNAAPIWNLELAYDILSSTKKHAFAFNLGYRSRSPGEIPADAAMFPLDDQLTYSLGYSNQTSENMRLIGEIYGASPLRQEPYEQAIHASALEVLGAVRGQIVRDLWAHGGATVGLLNESQSPDWRAFVGINYYFTFGQRERPRRPPPAPYIPTAPEDDEVRPSLTWTLPLTVSPSEADLLEGETTYFRVEGGEPPYQWRLSRDFGKLDPALGEYAAPVQAGQVQMLVTDQSGDQVRVPIRVRAAPKPDRTVRLRNLKFVFDSDELIPDSRVELNRVIDRLRQVRIGSIIVEGHTDSVGNRDYNRRLSLKRAEAVRQALIERLGLEPDQVKALGFGMERPLRPNDTAENRQVNRRVELGIYYGL